MKKKKTDSFDYYLFLNGVKESDLIEVVSESIETYDECMIEIAQNILKNKFSYDIDLLQVLIEGYAKEIMEFLNNELTKESFKELLVSKRIN
ncbi:hypothetical protein HpHA283_15100 [Helicobacter pylori]